ncbi:MAG: hypothetical protein P8075_09390 [Deltaproteobacteria bacterium]
MIHKKIPLSSPLPMGDILWGWTPVGLLYLTTKTTKRMSVVRGQSLKSLKP